MRTLSVNASNDIYLGSNGNLSISFDLEAVLQACAQVAKVRLGEVVLNTDEGMPFFETVWVGVPNIQQYQSALRRAFLGVSGVVEVVSLITTQEDHLLSYTAVIRTIYGGGAISG